MPAAPSAIADPDTLPDPSAPAHPAPVSAQLSKMGNLFKQSIADEPPKPVVADPAVEPVKPAPDAKQEPKKLTEKEINFKKLNEQFDKARAEFEKEKSELVRAREQDKASASKELESIRQEKEQYENIVKRVALEHDPKFKEAFDRKIESAILTVKEAVGGENAVKVEKLLKLPPSEWRDEQIEHLTEGLSEFKRGRIVSAYNALGEVQRQREGELSKASENVQALAEFRQREQVQQQAEKRQFKENIFQEKLAKFSNIFPDFKEKEGDAEHNAIVSETRQLAKDWLSVDHDENSFTNLVLYAAKGKNSTKTDAIRDALIAKLQTQVQELTAAVPPLKGQGGSKGKAIPGSGKDVASRYHSAMERGIPAKQAA